MFRTKARTIHTQTALPASATAPDNRDFARSKKLRNRVFAEVKQQLSSVPAAKKFLPINTGASKFSSTGTAKAKSMNPVPVGCGLRKPGREINGARCLFRESGWKFLCISWKAIPTSRSSRAASIIRRRCRPIRCRTKKRNQQ